MAYGHAERTLATIRMLEAETMELLSGREHLDPEQAEWLRDVAESAELSLVTLADHSRGIRWSGQPKVHDRLVSSRTRLSRRPRETGSGMTAPR